MKVLSIAIPSYNSEAYMANCIESLLTGGEDVEILVVNDGSKDGTARIADEYAAKYPNIVRAIHQENGGHGEDGVGHTLIVFFCIFQAAAFQEGFVHIHPEAVGIDQSAVQIK